MKKMFAIVLALMLCVSVLSVAAFAAEGDTVVHAKVPAEWNAPNVYGWTDPTGNPAWPGTAMTADGEWWVGTIDAANDRVIINNSDGTSGPQTVDITIEAGKEVWLVISEEGGSFNASVSYEGPDGEVVTPPPADDKPAANATYIVAGNSKDVFGAEWDPSAEANKMTKGDDGIYSITYTNVAAGNYSLKVTDGTWTNSWGGYGENGNFDIELTAASDVTVKFNPKKNQVSIVIGDEVIDGPAGTGDVSLAAVSVALLAATAGLVAVVSKKKEF